LRRNQVHWSSERIVDTSALKIPLDPPFSKGEVMRMETG
jgi:hypothetical protein